MREDRVIIRVDGAARGNPGPAGIGGVIEDAEGRTLKELSEYIGEVTNNTAEYLALINALKEAAVFSPGSMTIYSDSELLVRQLNGHYKIKNGNLKNLASKARALLQGCGQTTLIYVPREDNQKADGLANQAIDDHQAGLKEQKKIVDLPEQGGLF